MIRCCYSALSFGVMLLLLGGCQGFLSTRLPPSPVLSSAAPIWQHLRVRRQAYANLKGLARLRFRSPERRGTLDTTVVALERFDRVRLEGIGPLGQPLFLLISAAQQFALYLPQERRVFAGPASSQQFVRLFGLAIEPGVLPYVFIGDVPFLNWPDAGPITYLADDDLYFWEGQAPRQPWRYRIWFDPDRLLPVRFDMLQAPERIVLQVMYQGFRRLNGFTMPYRITMTQPATERRVIWHYHEVQLNVGVEPTLFHLRVPPGTERVELD